MDLRATYRDAGVVTVVDIGGRITLGEGSALLRKTIRDLLDEGRTKIVLNLADVNYIDSSGIGELVTAFTTVKKTRRRPEAPLSYERKSTTCCSSPSCLPCSTFIPTRTRAALAASAEPLRTR